MKKIFHENGLSLVLGGLFILFFIAQSITGYIEYNHAQTEHAGHNITYLAYLHNSHFVEATMENWESEFLQAFFYLLFTSFLHQKGSAESKKLDESETVDRDPYLSRYDRNVPFPVRRRGVWLFLYQYSLCIAFFILFLICFILHAIGGAYAYNAEQLTHGQLPVSTLQYLLTARFWFESFQNWQSEFLALAAMVILTIFLRQKGSPQSKPVDSPHEETGK